MNQKNLVLCVDDEPNVLRSYKRALRNEPYEVLFASSAQEALAFLKVNTIQAVVTDFRMPDMNGIELVQEIRKLSEKTVCAVLSGYADEEVIQNALSLRRISRFLVKPIDNENLKKEILALLQQYKN